MMMMMTMMMMIMMMTMPMIMISSLLPAAVLHIHFRLLADEGDVHVTLAEIGWWKSGGDQEDLGL